MPTTPTDVRFFPAPEDFRAWLAEHHETARELWVGYLKKGTGEPSVTWPETVDEALCFGWIDGVRKGLDERSFAIRFTPRKPTSIWSAVNIARVAVLEAEGRMRPAGVAAFTRRKENRSGVYSFEQRSVELPAEYAERLRADAAADEFFASRPASYRKAAMWWVVSAKQEATREKRLATLLELSAAGKLIPQFTPRKASY